MVFINRMLERGERSEHGYASYRKQKLSLQGKTQTPKTVERTFETPLSAKYQKETSTQSR